MKHKIVFATFADNKYIRSLERIEKEARQFNCIDEVCIFHENDIDLSFKKRIKPWLYRRGYGYWRWKAYFAQIVFSRLTEGDVLIWADAGCELLPSGEQTLLDWIEKTKQTQSGIVVFQQKLTIGAYTKGDLINYLHVSDSEKAKGQFWGGAWIVRKTINSEKIINEWLDICTNHGDLITDKKSIFPNSNDFVEHRHDQSVFSILSLRSDATIIPTSFLKEENNSPILASRKKERTTQQTFKERMYLPFRFLLGCYLKYVKGFYFKDRIAW